MGNEFSRKEQALIRMATNQLLNNGFDARRGGERVKQRLKLRRRKNLLLRYAAVVIVLLGSGMLIWLYPETEVTSVPVASGIMRATGTPELILATGERVLLDSSARVKVKQPGATIVFDSVSSQLQYKKDEKAGHDEPMVYNQLYTPKGGEYSLMLADGTKVWLNAESTLRFPVKFASEKREVFLDGEAYFEVTPDQKCPFIVRMGQRTVQVLGTCFNICAYHMDNYWQTTLVTGKVNVQSDGDTFLLSPSEQFTENVKTGKKEVRKIDISEYLSWREGIIRFKGERLEDIVQKLERWYDFQMFYANDQLRNMRFRGVFNKYDSFDVVLRKLEQTTNIRFDIKGNTVIACVDPEK